MALKPSVRKRLNRIKVMILCLLCFYDGDCQQYALAYYQKNNQAELAICDSNLPQANAFYKEAFRINPDKPFSSDLGNAFFAAIDSREYNLAQQYLTQLFWRGLSTSFIQKSIRSYYKGAQLKAIDDMLKQNLSVKTKPASFVAEINKMMKADQNARAYYAALNNGAYMVDSVYALDYKNALKLQSLFKKYGVPNEAIYGNAVLENGNPFYKPTFYALVYHHNGGAAGGRPAHTMDSLLYKALFTYDLAPESFAMLIHANPAGSTFQYRKEQLFLPFMIEGACYNERIHPGVLG